MQGRQHISDYPSKSKKSHESIHVDVTKEGKASEIVEGDLNMEEEIDELQDDQRIVKVRKGKGKMGKNFGKEKKGRESKRSL